MEDQTDEMKRIAQQNNVSGDQYNAGRDQYNVHPGGSLTINTGGEAISHDHDAILADYRRHLIATHSTIRLFQFGSSAVTVGLEASYIQLQAARRSEDVDKLHADIDRQKQELEHELRQREQLTEREIQERLSDYDFHYRAGLALDAEQKGLHEVVAAYPRLIILGEPGAGKTTMLRHLAHTFAQENPDLGLPQPVKPRLPLYIKLAEIKSYNIAGLIEAALPSIATGAGELRQALEEEIAAGRVLFLLDGLDEVPGERQEELRTFLDNLGDTCQTVVGGKPVAAPLSGEAGGNRIIISCRVAGYAAALSLDRANAHFTILGMRVDEQTEFIQRLLRAWAESRDASWVLSQREALTRQLARPTRQRLAQVPLLLSMITYLWLNGSQLPDTRGELYRWVVELLLGWRGKHDREKASQLEQEVYEKVGRLAYCMLANRPRGMVSNAEGMQFLDKRLWQQLQYDEGGLFVLRGQRPGWTGFGGNDENNLYGFPHLSFEEYFAGYYLVRGQDLNEKVARIRSHLHDANWQEAILLGLGYACSANPADAQELLWRLCLDPTRTPSAGEEVLHRDLLFALRSAAEGVSLSEARQKELSRQVVTLYCRGDQGQGGRLYRGLIIQLEIGLRWASGSRISEMLVAQLRHLVTDQDLGVRLRVAHALGYIGGETLKQWRG